MSNGYILVSAADDNQPINQYWNGTVWTAIDNSINPQDAALYVDKSSARVASAQLQQRFPSQVVFLVPATRTVTMQFSSQPEVLPPAAAGSPAGSPAG